MAARLNLTSTAALGFLGSLVVQGYYAGHRPLPSFENLDASGTFGATGRAPVVRMAALGDSTLTGPGLLGPDEIWVRQALGRYDGDCRIELKSFATGGAKAADVLRHQLAPALACQPDIALVSVGSNDAIRGVSVTRFRSELTVIAQSLADRGALVALVGVGDLGSIPRLPAPLAQLMRLRSAVFERIHIRVAANHPQIVKVPIRDIAAKPFRTLPGLFSPDLFHPSRDGHAVWANAAYPTLSRLIRRAAERKQPCAD